MQHDKLVLSWREVVEDANFLSEQLKARMPNASAIVAISRGGLFPALLVAHRLGIKVVETMCVASYENEQQCGASILKAPSAALIDEHGANLLVIDDLADKGLTAELVRSAMPLATFATLYTKPMGAKSVDWYARPVIQDRWVVFPWE